jgi:hypothetical protein
MTDTTHAVSEDYSREWCRTTFYGLADGGIWGVPRSGLIFTKRDGGLVLTDIMDWHPAMDITEAELVEQQTGDYEVIREQFELAGIPVSKREGLLG